MKDIFNFVMCQYTCDQICFKFGMVLNNTKLNSFIPVWMTLMLTDGRGVTGKLELLQSFCCKTAWSYSNVRDGWLRKGDDCEEVL